MQLPPSFVTFRLEFTTKTEWRSGRLNAAIEDDYLVMYTPSEVKIFHLPTRRYYCVPESGSGVGAPPTFVCLKA
jgi:hypothetical protein